MPGVKLKMSCYNHDWNWSVEFCCHNAHVHVQAVHPILVPVGILDHTCLCALTQQNPAEIHLIHLLISHIILHILPSLMFCMESFVNIWDDTDHGITRVANKETSFSSTIPVREIALGMADDIMGWQYNFFSKKFLDGITMFDCAKSLWWFSARLPYLYIFINNTLEIL